MTRYASRKFVVAMAAIASASWLVYAGHIADGVYSAVVIAAVGGMVRTAGGWCVSCARLCAAIGFRRLPTSTISVH